MSFPKGNKQIQLVAYPSKPFVIEDSCFKSVNDEAFDPNSIKESDLNGGVLTKNLYISIEPVLMVGIRPPTIPAPMPPFQLNKPIRGYSIVEIRKSDHPDFKVGEHYVTNQGEFSQWSIVRKEELEAVAFGRKAWRKVENKEGIRLSYYVGMCGLSGSTGRYGFYYIGQPKAGQTIFVSSATGGVGQLVVQLAKREGLKVVASAGSDEKVKYLREELGVDVVFNYKTEDMAKILADNPLDIYFDNVGGPTLEAAIAAMKPGGRIVACGFLANSATGFTYGIKNLHLIVQKEITLQGFTISQFTKEKEFLEDIPAAIAKGELKVLEHVVKDFGEVPDRIKSIFDGKNFGKVVVAPWEQ